MACTMLSTKEGLKFTAVLCGGVVAGTALYISVVEVGTRRGLPIASMREQWNQSFNLAAKLVLGSGSIKAAATVALYFTDESPVRNLWLVYPAIYLLGGVYTAFLMLPEIKELKNDEIVRKKGDKWVEEAIERWAGRHLVRTVLNMIGFGSVIYTTIKSN